MTTNDKAKTHWNSFYQRPGTGQATPFLHHCLEDYDTFSIDDDEEIVDLGCGDGRDTLHLHSHGFNVTGIDISEVAVRKINKTAGKRRAIQCAFSDLPNLTLAVKPTLIYARFIFHAITLEDEHTALTWAHRVLGRGGRLLIECRTIHDPLYGKGEQVGDHEFVDGHYRRFLDYDFFNRIADSGFKIRHVLMDRGLAVHNGEDPLIMRISAHKVVE